MMFWRMIATVLRDSSTRSGQDAQRVAQEDQVAGLGGEVGADAAQRDAGVGLGQGRGVVDAVADHRHSPPGLLPLLDPPRLVGRQQLRLRPSRRGPSSPRRARPARDRRSGSRSPDLQVLQVVDHVVGFGPDRVADADHAGDPRRRSRR